MNLYLAHVNTRSLLANFEAFQHHISSSDYDVIGVTETWMRPDIDEHVINIDSYNFFGKNRINRRGGGVGLYIKHNFVAEVLFSISVEFIECLWLKLELLNEIVIIGNIYRPPDSNVEQFLTYIEDILSNLYAEYDNITCFGDFNINMLNMNSNVGMQLESVFTTFNMSQVIKEPTRFSSNSISLIDLMFTNFKNVVEAGVVDSNIADHMLTYMKIGLTAAHNTPISFSYRSINSINLNQFYLDLEQLQWHNIFYLRNIDDKLNYFNSLVLNIFDLHAPVKQFHKDKHFSYAPWITDNVKLMQKLRNKALKKYKQTKNPAHYDSYKQLRNYTTSAIRAEKKTYLRIKFHNSTNKEKWQELKRLDLVKRTNYNLPFNLSNPDNINTFFINSTNSNADPRNEVLEFYSKNRLENVNEVFEFKLSDENEIFDIIKNIKSKAFGADKINITMIHLCCPFIIPFVTHIINECILNSYFPDLWKQAEVIPFPKVSNPTEYGHLRCINILPALSKILERIMDRQIRQFLNQYQVLPEKQSGFRANHSCESALACITDDIFRSVDANKISALISLDFSKAFDMLNHKILHSILHYIGFSDNATNFIRSFLSDRSQQVVYNKKYSAPLSISVGVPQGSILGPLLYTIYTFNFHKSLKHCNYHFYADDAQIYLSFSEHESRVAQNLINSDLAQFFKVTSDHLLKLNPNKSSVIVFGNQSQVSFTTNNMEVKLNDIILPFSKSCKSLGLILDSMLRFKQHITSKLRSAYGNLKLIYNQRHFLCKETRKQLCDALVLSQFNHCSSVYFPCLDALDRYRVQKVQNSCLRLIYGVRRRNHITPYLVESKWLNMFNRFRMRMSYIGFKIIKYEVPCYLYQKLSFRADINSIGLRRKQLLTVPRHRKEIFKRSFSYNICTHLNALPDIDFRQSNLTFKQSIKKRLLNLQ